MVSKITETACGYHVRTNRRLALYILFLILKTSDYHLFRFSGAEANKSCIFPFQFGYKKYYGCLPRAEQVFIYNIYNMFIDYNELQTWCATEVDKDGIFQGDPGVWEDPWGFCGPDCPTHEETLTWRKDETVKVTLHYYNPLLWTGLKFYGILSSCLLLYSLILTAVLSAIGTIIVIISYNCFHFFIQS